MKENDVQRLRFEDGMKFEKVPSKITPSLTVGHRTLGPENFL